MADRHLFKEPHLKDLEEEVVFDLATEFGTLVIKKVLDFMRDSTPFQGNMAHSVCAKKHSV